MHDLVMYTTGLSTAKPLWGLPLIKSGYKYYKFRTYVNDVIVADIVSCDSDSLHCSDSCAEEINKSIIESRDRSKGISFDNIDDLLASLR